MDKECFENNLKQLGDDFGKYGKLYFCTNENLKDYIPDLTNKKTLTVSASGDHLLNCACNGATYIDTFDVNYYSSLYQELKIQAALNLDDDELYTFYEYLYYPTYTRLRENLSDKAKELFDFLFHNYSNSQIMNLLFYPRDVNSKDVNNYYIDGRLDVLRDNLRRLVHNHFYTNLYNLPYFLENKYDTLFFSNISHYSEPESFISYLQYLSDYFLNDNGEIYFGYIYNTNGVKTATDGIKHISDKYNQYKDLKNFAKCVEIKVIDSAEYSGSKDAVLVYKKEKAGE